MDNQSKKTGLISIFVVLGLLITIDLAYIYYQANFNQYALPSFCSISEFVDCDGVARTTESQFFGVPLAYWGLLLYSFIITLLCVDKLKKIPFLKFLEVFKNKFHYIASLGLISFAISMLLLCVSLFSIKKLCVMCAITYVIDFSIALIAVQGIKGSFIGAIKQSWKDFVDALEPIPYRIAFICVMICAIACLSWTTISAKFSPALKTKRAYGEFINAKTNKYAIKGNVLGSDAKDAIVIHVYTDYMCPMCYVFNIMTHKLATEFENIRIEHHNMPLDMDCNPYLKQEFHHNSCVMARYALAAEEQGKFWEVSSLLFDKKPKTEEDVVTTLADSNFNLDMEKLLEDANSKAVNNKIQNDINNAVAHGQIGTPTMQIGDKFEMGIPKGGYPTLRKMVIENGGIPKNKLF